MIIQCRKCETRFRFDEKVMEGDGVWVRCSRCGDVFFQDRPAGDAHTAPDIPSVRVSEARRAPENRFPPVEHRVAPEVKAEATHRPEPEEGEEAGEPPEFEKEPSLDGLNGDLDKEPPGPADDLEKDDLEKDEEALPVPPPRRWGRTLLKLAALLFFIVIVAGTVYLYLFPEVRSQVMEPFSPWLKGVPYLENLVDTGKGSGAVAVAPVFLKDIRQRSVSNLLVGNLRVIEGIAVNQASYPLARMRVRLVIADAYDVVLGEKVVYCGNILTDAELGAMAEAEILRELSIPQGSDIANERIAPKGEIPFMIVFNQEQTGAVKTTVTPAGADRAP